MSSVAVAVVGVVVVLVVVAVVVVTVVVVVVVVGEAVVDPTADRGSSHNAVLGYLKTTNNTP